MENIALYKIAEIIAGQSPPSSTYNQVGDGLPFFQGKADFGETYPTVRFWCSSPQKISEINDILISVRAPVGSTNINNTKACIGRGLTAIRCNNDKVSQKYLLHFLKWYEPQLVSKGNGAVFAAITQKDLKEIPVPLPPLATQKHIADILDAADALRRKTQQIVDSYDELAQSLFLEMFGDPFKNSKNWELVEFKKLGSLDRGKSKHRPRNAPELLGGSHPLIQTGDIANAPLYLKNYKSTYSDIGLAQSKKWPKGTLCITIAANIAKCSILSFEACFPDSVVGFIPNDKTVNEYIYFLLSILQGSIEELAPAAAQKNINLKFLRELQIPTPPIDLQNQFAEKIALIEQQKELAKQSLAESENLFNALLQKAFKGELVPEPQPAEQAV